MAIAGKLGRVYLGYGESATAFTNVTCNSYVGYGYKLYFINDRTKRFWDPNTPVVVKVNDVTVTTGFRVYRAGGFIEFDEALSIGDTVKASGAFIPFEEFGSAKQYTFDVKQNTQDVSAFNTTAHNVDDWIERIVVSREFSGSIDLFYTDSQAWRDAMIGNPDVGGGSVEGGFALYVELALSNIVNVYAIVIPTGDSAKIPKSGVIENTVTFEMAEQDPPFFV